MDEPVMNHLVKEHTALATNLLQELNEAGNTDGNDTVKILLQRLKEMRSVKADMDELELNNLVDNLQNADKIKRIQERAKYLHESNEQAARDPEPGEVEAELGLTIKNARKRIINILYQLEKFIISDEEEHRLKHEVM